MHHNLGYKDLLSDMSAALIRLRCLHYLSYKIRCSSCSEVKLCHILSNWQCSLFLLNIQVIHKRMVRFQKLTRNLFLTLHGHNVHRQQRQLSKFLMRYQQFASHAYCGAAGGGQFSRWRRSRKRLSVCSVLRCPDLWLQCSVSFVHGLEKTHVRLF